MIDIGSIDKIASLGHKRIQHLLDGRRLCLDRPLLRAKVLVGRGYMSCMSTAGTTYRRMHAWCVQVMVFSLGVRACNDTSTTIERNKQVTTQFQNIFKLK